MAYFNRYRTIQRSSDPRVLKAQLGLVADVLEDTRITAPLWAISSVGLLLLIKPLSNASVFTAAIGPLLVVLSTVAAQIMVRRYRMDVQAQNNAGRLDRWFDYFIMMQVVTGMSWGSVTWLMWQDGNPLNHLYLAVYSVGVLAWLIVSRISHIEMSLSSTLPMLSLAVPRFLIGGSLADTLIAAGMTAYALQIFYDAKRLTNRLDQDSRLRFEVEDLARELEEARDEALRKRFEAETANASKTAFLANMSHELRTPLNAILGFSEIIAKECFGTVGSPRYIEYAGDIHSSGAHLLSLINDLLDVAKIEAGRMEIQPEPLDAQKTLETALKLVGAKARERHQTLIIDTAAEAPELYADERALKQIVINLVSNAVKFTPEGGRITVLGNRARCGGFQIMVEDTGPGIPREKLDRIFKPFSQVDNRYDRQEGGTGLGLALVRGLAELHGGRAWVESEPGKGCRAYVVLPQFAVQAASAEPGGDAIAAA